MKKYFLGFAVGILSSAGFCQSTIKGKVINEKTKEPLPFVNITIDSTTSGTTSDVEGRFDFTWSEPRANVIFSYVGFESFTYHYTPDNKSLLLIKLKEKTTELHEVVIRPGVNPALRIIRNAIQNKPLNNPENLPSFSYHTYNKLYLALDGVDSAKNKQEKQFQKFGEHNDLFVSESYTERKYVRPNFSKETVLGNRVSGVKDPFFTFLASDFQPFSFYKDFILLLNVNYLNPISVGSPEKYDFALLDTLYHGKDSVFVITFEPLPGKSFEGLKGQLYISSDGYALEHVLAQAADPGALLEFRIQQKYVKVEGHWFPAQLNTELRFKEYKVGNQKPMYVNRSYLSDVHIGTEFSKKEFGLLNVEFDPRANRQTESFWNVHRPDSLGRKEKNTYRFYDSLGPKLDKINFYMKMFEGLIVGRFNVGSFYLPLEDLVKVNQYEGFRLGIGLQTSERISKFFRLEGYVGYGFKDMALKYGGALRMNVIPRRDGFLRFSYKQDIGEPGSSNFLEVPPISRRSESVRNWMASRMDSIKQYKAEFGIRTLRSSQFSFFVQRQLRHPTYQYSFITEKDASGLQRNFIATEVGVQWRFAWKESYTQIGNSKVATNIAYPTINFFVSRGMAGVWDGEYNFTKLETRVDQQWVLRGFGKTTIQFDAGKIVGQVPYPFLFNGRGSNYSSSSFNRILVTNYFQTMGLYEFASDQFAYLFLTHNFGRLTGTNNQYFRPELSLVHNMGIGSLANKDAHQGIVIKTMEKGFFESGLMLNNLVRFKYLKLFYYGIGAGAFYRYGNYALPRMSDNFAFKIIATATF